MSDTEERALSRRRLLSGAAQVGAAAGLAFAAQDAEARSPKTHHGSGNSSTIVDHRRGAAREIRDENAKRSTISRQPKLPAHGAYQRVELYSKGIERVGTGEDPWLPKAASFDTFRDVLDRAYSRTSSAGLDDDFDKIDRLQDHLTPSDRFRLTNPLGGLSFDSEGPDSFATTMKEAPSFRSAQTAAEMAELYWEAMLRDLPFSQLAPDTGNTLVRRALDDLNKFEWFSNKGMGPIRLNRMFRADLRDSSNRTNLGFEGVDVGPYLSQFLLRGTAEPGVGGLSQRLGVVNFGTLRLSQRQRTTGPRTTYDPNDLSKGTEVNALADFLTKPGAGESWYIVQNGSRSTIGRDNLVPANVMQVGDGPDHDRADESTIRGTLKFISTLRDGATYVHFDKIYQEYLIAACILLGGLQRGTVVAPIVTLVQGTGAPDVCKPSAPIDQPQPVAEFGDVGNEVLNVGNPYRDAQSQVGFATFGVTHIVTLLAEVSTRAHKAGWYHKWRMRRIRPEEFAGRVHYSVTGTPKYNIHPDLIPGTTKSTVLDMIKQFNAKCPPATESYLLPMAFAEGSPTHPAYPSGHATIAGACVTILKALFNETFVLTNNGSADKSVPVFEPSFDGTKLVESSSQPRLTIGGELHKLASNVTGFRSFAGVHWRSDSVEGMLLGEQVALYMLLEQTQPSKGRGGHMPFYRERLRSRGSSRHPYGGAPFFRLSLFNGRAFDIADGRIHLLERTGPDSASWRPTRETTSVEELVASYRN